MTKINFALVLIVCIFSLMGCDSLRSERMVDERMDAYFQTQGRQQIELAMKAALNRETKSQGAGK